MCGASGCGHWEVDIRTVYLIMKYPYSACVCAFRQPHPYFLFNFVNYFSFLCEFGWVSIHSNYVPLCSSNVFLVTEQRYNRMCFPKVPTR